MFLFHKMTSLKYYIIAPSKTSIETYINCVKRKRAAHRTARSLKRRLLIDGAHLGFRLTPVALPWPVKGLTASLRLQALELSDTGAVMVEIGL